VRAQSSSPHDNLTKTPTRRSWQALFRIEHTTFSIASDKYLYDVQFRESHNPLIKQNLVDDTIIAYTEFENPESSPINGSGLMSSRFAASQLIRSAIRRAIGLSNRSSSWVAVWKM
jgi:hypothetical protein